MKYYTGKYDRAFKEIMLNEKNKDILKFLLESILEIKINNIQIKRQERNVGNINVKGKTVDALLETDIGKVQIEVNTSNEYYVHPRNMAYISDIYSHNTLVGEIYTEDIMHIQINLSYGIKDNKAYRIYYVQDEEGKKFIENLKIYEYNMDFYKKIWDNKKEELIRRNKALVMLNLEKEDLQILSKKDKAVEKYMKELDRLNEDPEFREYMSYEEDQRKILNSRLKKAEEDGIEKGIKKGIKEGINQGIENEKLQIVQNMLKKGLDINLISEITNTPTDEIESLK